MTSQGELGRFYHGCFVAVCDELISLHRRYSCFSPHHAKMMMTAWDDWT